MALVGIKAASASQFLEQLDPPFSLRVVGVFDLQLEDPIRMVKGARAANKPHRFTLQEHARKYTSRMLAHPATQYLHNNPMAYWCAGCWRWTLDCEHLVDPLSSPELKLEHFQYRAVTWARNILQVTMNAGERFQHFNVPRRLALEFVRNPGETLLKGYRFERVRGRETLSTDFHSG